ncbi:MAG: hypothetical protein UHS41_00615 [Lachnospiraceae bacterium]|nr:hypothetical protein [Lachnospiraceae bacterium]
MTALISVWEEGIEERKCEILRKDQSCQVLIIGGNLTGLFAALFCMEKGYQVLVIESGTLEQRAMEIDFFEKIRDLKSWTYSIWYAQIVAKYHLKCHFTRMPAFYYWLSQKPTAKMPKQPVFHPIKWMREIAALIKVFEEVEIIEIQEQRIHTSQAFVDFEYMIDARNKKEKQMETWIALGGISLDKGIYLCMDEMADFLMWKDKLIMKDAFGFLFPDGKIENQWEIDAGRKEGIYKSMEQARKLVKNLERK